MYAGLYAKNLKREKYVETENRENWITEGWFHKSDDLKVENGAGGLRSLSDTLESNSDNLWIN